MENIFHDEVLVPIIHALTKALLNGHSLLEKRSLW